MSALIMLPIVALILSLTLAEFSYGSALANSSGRVNVGVGDNVAIAGVIISGSGVEHLILRGLGTSLPFANRLMNPYLRFYNADGSVIAENNNWRDTQEDGIIRNGLAPPSDLESAINIFINPGSYTAILSGVNGGTGIGLVEVYELDRRDAHLANMSTRGNVSGGGDNRGIAGVTITGDGTRDILFRGLGPSLPLANRLGNPYLELYNSSGNLIYGNDNWKDSQQNAITATGIAPANDLESAIRRTLSAGSYTAILKGYTNGTGIASVEAYDVTGSPTSTPTPTPVPTPTPTPVPQRLVWRDNAGGTGSAGYNSSSHPNDPTFELKRSAMLYPQRSGGITVHFTGFAYGPYPIQPFRAQMWPDLLDQNGNKIAEGNHIEFYPNGVESSGTATFSTSGAPFTIRMMISSGHSFPSPDSISLTYYDVYAP